MPCFHCARTSSHEKQWNSKSCPEGLPLKKNGISTAKAAAAMSRNGFQNSDPPGVAKSPRGRELLPLTASAGGVASVSSFPTEQSLKRDCPSRLQSIFNPK